MKVLITGSYGFLGYNLAMKLLSAGHEVVGIDRVDTAVSQKAPRIEALKKASKGRFKHEECDIQNFRVLEAAFKKHRPTHVMHFAAQYAVAGLDTALMRRYMDSNCLGFVNVLEACRYNDIKRFTYASSTFVEDGVRATHMYGATKKFNEDAASVYSHMSDIETVGIRYGSTFGEHCRPDVGPYLAAKRLFDGKPHPMKGGYLYQTAFLWAPDAIDITLDLMRKPMSEKWNCYTLVMNDHRYSLLEVARLMSAYTGKPMIIREGDTEPEFEPGGVPEDRLAKLEAAIGYRPPTDMAAAVAKFCDWFRERHEAGLA